MTYLAIDRGIRFQKRKAHILKEVSGDHGRSYCGQSEREGIWLPLSFQFVPSCLQCLRFYGRRQVKEYYRDR